MCRSNKSAKPRSTTRVGRMYGNGIGRGMRMCFVEKWNYQKDGGAPLRSPSIISPDAPLWRLFSRRLQDRRPARDLTLGERRELRLSAFSLGGNTGAEVCEAFLHARIIERLFERRRQPIEYRLRHVFRGEERPPRLRLKFRKSRLNSRRDIWEIGVSCRCGDRVSLHQAAENLLPDVAN